jgi:hypothetical protein
MRATTSTVSELLPSLISRRFDWEARADGPQVFCNVMHAILTRTWPSAVPVERSTFSLHHINYHTSLSQTPHSSIPTQKGVGLIRGMAPSISGERPTIAGSWISARSLLLRVEWVLSIVGVATARCVYSVYFIMHHDCLILLTPLYVHALPNVHDVVPHVARQGETPPTDRADFRSTQ